MSVEGSGDESSDGGQDLVGRFCPTKGFGLLIVGSDEIPDYSFQFLNASVRAALDPSLGQECEPPFDLVGASSGYV